MSTICLDESTSFSSWFNSDYALLSDEGSAINRKNEQAQNEIKKTSAFLARSLPLESAFVSALKEGWDGYDAETINISTFEYARKFIELLPFDTELPEFVPESDGEISIEWFDSPSWIFSISVSPKGRLSYVGFYGRNRTKGVEYLNDKIPQSILSNIKRVLKK